MYQDTMPILSRFFDDRRVNAWRNMGKANTGQRGGSDRPEKAPGSVNHPDE